MYDVTEWRHAFKLDPDRDITDEALEMICESGTDAVIVGGSDNIELEDVLNLMARVRRFAVPCVLEVSHLDAISPGFDLFFIPVVLNSGNTNWVTGFHHEAIKEYGEIMNWDEMIVEGYCIVNPDCKAATLTEAQPVKTKDEVAAYAMMAQNMFRMPIFYLEYSGVYGDPTLVAEAKKHLDQTTLFYGGGIQTVEQAIEMGSIADVIVVGNVIYSDLKEAIKTVSAVKSLTQ